MRYKVGYNDSPARIAHAHGVPFNALIRANPHKPTRVVAGRTTWQGLGLGEEINVPGVGALGDAASDVISALMGAGGPCKQSNVALVCAVQRALGVVVDGKYGSGTSAAARAVFPGAPAGCSPTPSWWVKGQSACPSVSAPIPIPLPAPIQAAASGSPVPNPCDPANVAFVCALQRTLGVTVDGKYGNDTATAARRMNPSAPPGCSPRPSWWKPVGQNNCAGAASSAPAPFVAPPSSQPSPVQATPAIFVPPAPPNVPAAVQALASINPCLQQNVETVRNAQRALGLEDDGKYGTNTSSAARRLVPNAPAGCSPAPLWWGAKGSVVPQGPPPPPIVVSASAPPAFVPSTVVPAPVPSGSAPASAPPSVAPPGVVPGPAQPIVVAPEAKKALSTGTIVAGAVGVAALVGLIAVAASGKKSTSTRTTITRPGRRAARKTTKRKSTPRKKSKSRSKKR